MPPSTLEINLEALRKATGGVRFEFPREPASSSGVDSVTRFYHLLLLECCERMTVTEFRNAVSVAREQVRKPV